MLHGASGVRLATTSVSARHVPRASVSLRKNAARATSATALQPACPTTEAAVVASMPGIGTPVSKRLVGFRLNNTPVVCAAPWSRTEPANAPRLLYASPCIRLGTSSHMVQQSRRASSRATAAPKKSHAPAQATASETAPPPSGPRKARRKSKKPSGSQLEARNLSMVRQYIHSWQSGIPVDHFTARSIIDALLTVPSGQLVPPTSLMLVLNILEQQERHPDGPDVSWDCLPLVEALAAQPAMPDRAAHLRALMDRVGDGRLVLDRPHPGLWRPLRKLYTSASHWAAAAHVFKLAKDAPGTAADLLARVVRFAFADAPVMERADFLACVQWSGLSPRFAGPLGAAYVETLAARVRASRDEDEAVWALRTVVAVEGALKGRDPDATSRDPDRNRSAYRDAVTRALKAIAAAGIDARTAQFKLKKPESRGLDKNTRESILDEFRAIVEADAATIKPRALQGKLKPPHLLSSKAKADIHAAVQSVLRMFEMEFGDADGGAERKGRTELTGGGKKAKSASKRAAVSG